MHNVEMEIEFMKSDELNEQPKIIKTKMNKNLVSIEKNISIIKMNAYNFAIQRNKQNKEIGKEKGRNSIQFTLVTAACER